jgi:hypothetical protein
MTTANEATLPIVGHLNALNADASFLACSAMLVHARDRHPPIILIHGSAKPMVKRYRTSARMCRPLIHSWR